MRYAITRKSKTGKGRALVSKGGKVLIFKKKLLAKRKLKKFLGMSIRPRIIKLERGE